MAKHRDKADESEITVETDTQRIARESGFSNETDEQRIARERGLTKETEEQRTAREKAEANAPVPGSYETEAQRTAREDREKAAAESGGATRMSPVNPRKPLDKEPHYAPGTGGNLGFTGDLGVHTTTDPRIPPENVTTPGVAPGSRVVNANGSTDPLPGQQGTQPVAPPVPAPTPTPAQAGLPQPELRPGLDPLPEEEPTPSTVPIPPPGPRRVA